MTWRLTGFCLALTFSGACASGPPVEGPPAVPPAAEESPAAGDEFKAAGIFAVSRHEGMVKALLGLDAHTRRWADFVGFRENRETAVQTAVREFTEETRGAYEAAVTIERLAAASDRLHRVGAVRIFLLEVPFKEADLLAGLPGSDHAEKTHYCWVDLRVLLESADNSTGETSVPPECDGPGVDGRLQVRDVTAANLRRGGVLREPLDGIASQ